MTRKILSAAMTVGLLAIGAGCHKNSTDLAASVCQKAGDCNSLSGITADQCRNVVNTSLQSMSSTGRADAESALNGCLAMADCTTFGSCIDTALTGGSSTGGSTGTGGTTTGTGGVATGGSGGGGTGGGTSTGTGGSPTGGSGGGATGGSTSTGTGGSALGGSGGSATGGSGGALGGRGGGSPGTGGQPGTGGGTGGSSSAPELMTSGPGAYWMTGQVTKVTTGTAGLVVDQNTKYQRFDGFGGAFNEMGWDALSVLSADQVTNAMKLLFDPQTGAKFIYGRVPIGASDYATSWYTLDDTAGDYSMSKFSIARDQQKLIPFIKAALQIQPAIKLWGSPWSPPSWMEDSNSNMKSDAQTQQAYALYLAKFVQEYAKIGITIGAVHPQNEPGYARVHWNQTLLVNFFKTYMGPTFAQQNLTAEVWCGTMSAPADANIATAVAADAASLAYVKGFGLQWNLQTTVATLAPKGIVMQTEHPCGNYNFDTPYWKQSQYNASKPPNDHAYGEESWQLIRDWIASGVNSYNAWNMVLDTVGKSLDGWPQDALLVVDRTAKTLTATGAYYAFRHFSAYIVPGATRIGTTGSTDALAFKNPDGSIIVEVYNKAASAAATTVGIGSALSQTLYQFNVPAHGWATLRVTP
jgi:glucosylceramidase